MAVLVECKQSGKYLVGYKWDLGKMKELSTDKLSTWAKKDDIVYDEDAYLRLDKCVGFDKEIWFELKKCMWRKHRSIYQDHLKYVCNDILKPFHF